METETLNKKNLTTNEILIFSYILQCSHHVKSSIDLT